MKYYQHKETQQITVCVTIQGPVWTLSDVENGECMNIEKTKFRAEWEEIPPPYPCQKEDQHQNIMTRHIMKGHCLLCKKEMEELNES